MADADVTAWSPQVEKRAHPPGEQGVVASLEAVAERVKLGAVSPKVRMWAIECLDRARTERGWRMDTERERAIVLLEACQKKLWVPDPIGVEWMAGAHLMACDATKDGVCFRGNDCFPKGTLMLAEGHELTPVENLEPGMKIWGLNKWSEVQAVEYKGYLPVDVITLSNGSEVKLTSDHHVYVLDCVDHPMLEEGEEPVALPEDRHWRGGGNGDRRWGCSCNTEHRNEKRCRVSELREGMVVPTPDRIPFGTESMDPDRALIEGLYVSDGWADYSKNSCFFISGQDGCPKEEQKHEVQSACERLEVPTSWKKKSISIRDKAWTLRVQQMGQYAPEKHLLSINLNEGTAAPTLRGVMADSGANTRGPSRTFTTTSRELAIQTRLLHKMFGIQCGWRYIENHGGLGENPIYRLGQRGRERTDGRKPWMLKVKNIEREVLVVPCWDIQTDDHRVYLAEHDVTVSQCDDLVILLGSCFSAVGIYTAIVGHAYNRGKDISHVLTSVWINGQWQYADPSTDLPLGECVQFTRERVYSVPNVQMICDANMCFTHPGRFDPQKNNFDGEGSFVGVSGVGVPQFAWLAKPSRKVQWLGSSAATESIVDAGVGAAYDRLASQSWPPTEESLADAAGAIGYAVSAAACAVVGAAPASLLCGTVGGAVTEFVSSKVIGGLVKIFGRRQSAAMREYRQRQEAWGRRLQLDGLVDDIDTEIGKQLIELTDALEAEYIELYGRPSQPPGTPQVATRHKWRGVLSYIGAPLQPDGGEVYGVPTFGVSRSYVDSMNTLYYDIIDYGASVNTVAAKMMAVSRHLMTEIGEAAQAVAVRMASQATADYAEQTALQRAKEESAIIERDQAQKNKRDSAWGWVGVAILAGGAAWWLL